MCTATWIHDGDRYSLFFNRDELRSRPRALPPRVLEADGVGYLAPFDPQAGGTWIAVNAHGLSICLLNDYSSAALDPTGALVSRGLLVSDLAGAEDLRTLQVIWSEIDHRRYRPFTLLALAPARPARLFGWNGCEATSGERAARPPLCSSSFDDAGAARSRQRLLEEISDQPAIDPRKRQLRYHQSHLPERGPYSVCMHRPDAATVSFTLVGVEPESVSMAYASGPPCSHALDHLKTLERL